jgi:hypothetical protein
MWSFLNIEKDPIRVLVTGAAGMPNPLFFWFIFGLFDLFFFVLVGKVQVNINLGSNIFYFSIWAPFIVIVTKKILKKPNFEKAVRGWLPISLTANRLVNR